MADNSQEESRAPRMGSWKVTLIACVLLVLVAGGTVMFIFSTQPTAQRTTETRESAMLVEVVMAERGTFRPRIEAMGIVQPSRDITLSPRVSGQIIERAPAFTPGGFLEKREILLKIDPADYRNLLEQRQSELRQSVADLDVEMGRQRVAQLDFELLEESDAVRNSDLVLRQPQLNAAQAMVKSAQAAVDQAELDLERCDIRAPFDVHVIERNVDVGSQVAPGDDLGRLVGLETYWVVTTVPLSSVHWIAFPDGPDDAGSRVRVRNRSAWPFGATREGEVERLIGMLDDETRLARLLVTVDDPLARAPDSSDVPPLIIGSVVETVIEGKEIRDVIRLDRNYLRQDESVVWVMEENELRIVDVDVVFKDNEYAYVAGGLENGDQVVTTSLATVAEGAPLRLKGGGN